MAETISILFGICSLIGLDFDKTEYNKIENDCEKVQYIHNQIYKYLGGE